MGLLWLRRWVVRLAGEDALEATGQAVAQSLLLMAAAGGAAEEAAGG